MEIDIPAPKGVKRKAEDARFPPSPKRIKVGMRGFVGSEGR